MLWPRGRTRRTSVFMSLLHGTVAKLTGARQRPGEPRALKPNRSSCSHRLFLPRIDGKTAPEISEKKVDTAKMSREGK